MQLFSTPIAIPYIAKTGDKVYPSIVDIKRGVKSTEAITFVTADINSSFISLQLVDGIEPYSVSDARVICNITRPDSKGIEIICDIINDSTVEIPLGIAGTEIEGIYNFDIKIYKEANWVVGTPVMQYTVNASINSDEIYESDERLPILVSLITEVQELKSGLSELTTTTEQARQDTILATEEARTVVQETRTQVAEIVSQGTSKIEEMESVKQEVITTKDSLITQVNDKILEVDNTMSGKLTEYENRFGQFDATLDGKANASDVYTKQETMSRVEIESAIENATPNIDLTGYATKEDVKAKSDLGHTHSYSEFTDAPQIPSIDGLASESYVNQQVAGIVNSAPETLDTLNELANALGNDPNFATTVMAEIGKKANTILVNEQLAYKADKSYVDTELADRAYTHHTHNKSEIGDFGHDHVVSDILDFNHNHNDLYYGKEEVNSSLNQKVDISELQVSENTPYITVNGIKGFECKDGYVDKVHIEGNTLVNLSQSVKMSMGAGATQEGNTFTLPKNGYVSFICTEQQLQGKTLTVKYFAPLMVGDSQLRMAIRYKTPTSELVDLLSYAYISEFSFTVPDVEYTGIYLYVQNMKDTVVAQEYKILCVEGDYTNKAISHFEGLKSVGQGDKIEVLSYGSSKKYPITTSGHTWKDGYFIDTESGTEIALEGYSYTTNYIPIEKILDCIVLVNANAHICFYDENKNYIPRKHEFYMEKPIFSIASIPNNVKFIRYTIETKNKSNHELYQSKYDKKQISTTCRGIKDNDGNWIVRDEIVQQGDKYYKIQKCGERTLNGNEDDWYISNTFSNCLGFGTYIEDSSLNGNIISDKFNYEKHWNDTEHIVMNSEKKLVLFVNKSKLTTQDVNGFKAWLKANPVTVVYELATPIITEIPNFNPRTFGDKTTLLINSGVVQAEGSFEVTNSLGSSLDVMVNKVSNNEENILSLNTTSAALQTKVHHGQNHKLTDDIGHAINLQDKDVNNLTKTGLYMGDFLINAPDKTNWFFIEVKSHNNLYCIQTATIFTDPNAPKYERYYLNGAWQPWRSL